MIKENFIIKPISYQTAMRFIVAYHYLHRRCPCSFAFGLINNAGNIKGVICYGTPSSSPLRSGICGKDEVNNVIELTRLWICDSVGKNAESFLIGNTIKLVNKEIIVSYAEAEQGHIGTVYQATNWIYTGLSAKRTNWTLKELDMWGSPIVSHCQTLADKYTSVEIREKYGDNFSLEDRPRKHRYVYFNADKRRKIELLSKLNYPILDYPKK